MLMNYRKSEVTHSHVLFVISDLWYPIPLSIIVILIRYGVENFVFRPVGKIIVSVVIIVRSLSLWLLSTTFVFYPYIPRGGHRHMQVGRVVDVDLIPNIRSKGLNIVFQTTEGKIETYTLINFDWCRTPFLGIKFFTFNKKKSRHIPRFLKFVNFVNNFLHVILFLGLRDIPE